MNYPIRLEGIYDLTTLQSLQRNGVRDFTFDFRPRSFNFIQLYKFEEIIGQMFGADRIFLQFHQEQLLTISEICRKIPFEFQDRCMLELSGSYDDIFTRELPLPFYWKFDYYVDWKNMLNRAGLSGVVINYEQLKFLHESNQFLDFMKEFYQAMNSSTQGKLPLILSVDWDSDLFPSLMDLMEFTQVSLPINYKIESSYRVFNNDLFQSQYERVRHNFTL